MLLTFDPSADAAHALGSIAIGPPAPAAPALPPPNGVMALAARARLQATPDGRTIIGAHMLANNTRTVFVYDVNSSTVLRSRNVAAISSVLAVSPDGSQFLSGPLLFETLDDGGAGAAEHRSTAPFVFPAGTNFNTQTTQGGAVYAQTTARPGADHGLQRRAGAESGGALEHQRAAVQYAGQSADPTRHSDSRKRRADEWWSPPDGATIYAISQSGFLVLPHRDAGSNRRSRCRIRNVALLAFDQCGVTAAQNSAMIPVRNAGGGRLTVTAQVLATAATAATTRVTARPYGGDVTASFNAAAARTLGTAAPDQLLIQAAEAVNIIPNVRVFQNNRNTETRGTILPVDIGATTTGPDRHGRRTTRGSGSISRIRD